MGSDPVNRPKHYTFGKHEVIDVLQDWFPDDPLLWQVGKYIARAKHKGDALQDLKKARFYLERRIEELARTPPDPFDPKTLALRPEELRPSRAVPMVRIKP